ncbi:glycoside hydrolase family 12 protein [Echria macrotheca]|uniref:Glycoside hydrolase family 12 protein n=1 Tax=Echria macrotheca TaxID=438768 RepID=A0AAJ0F7F3_9PEZI|nr:glycoside hydrolase family 12 protein [Echria macrotheca]
MKSLLLTLLPSLAAAAAVSVSSLEPRQEKTLCDQYAYWSGNGYEINNNLWGRGQASSGQQCTYVDSSSGSGVQWHTTWTWQGGQNNVKSYVYIGKQIAKGKKISQISSMSTSVSWNYNSDNVRANVAYDIFTASDPNHDTSSGDYELMIWLARLGNVYPIGQSVGSATVNGRTWDLWVGMNGNMKVFSFIAPSPIKSFSGDPKQFFSYLKDKQGYPDSSQNLIVFQFGTEAFTGGPATLTVSSFSANVN